MVLVWLHDTTDDLVQWCGTQWGTVSILRDGIRFSCRTLGWERI